MHETEPLKPQLITAAHAGLHLAGVESPASRALIAATLVLLKCRGNDREKSLLLIRVAVPI
jgi:hypothetical protein